MWRPATRQITGTNDGLYKPNISLPFVFILLVLVPLGQRRRFGPAPAEETAPPQLAQPSPSAYPRSTNQDTESPTKRGRDESPSNGDPQGKPDIITKSFFAGLVSSLMSCVSSQAFGH
jgi:splicing factor 1